MSEFAKPFEEMARLIRHNDSDAFAGAFVLVPPGDNKPIFYFSIDPATDFMQLLAMARTRIQLAENELTKAEADPWARR